MRTVSKSNKVSHKSTFISFRICDFGLFLVEIIKRNHISFTLLTIGHPPFFALFACGFFISNRKVPNREKRQGEVDIHSEYVSHYAMGGGFVDGIIKYKEKMANYFLALKLLTRTSRE